MSAGIVVAKIILATVDGCCAAEMVDRFWQVGARCMAEGVDGRLRDRMRKPGKKAP